MALIYVVEDDAALRDELERLLQLQGFEAAHCDDFSTAAQAAVRSGADCVVLDLKLPGADGLQICRDIRRVLLLETAPYELVVAQCHVDDHSLGRIRVDIRLAGIRESRHDILQHRSRLREIQNLHCQFLVAGKHV